MAVTYRIEPGVVVLSFEGETDDGEIRAILGRLAEDPEVPTPWPLLLDVRGSSSLGRRSPERIRGLVDLMAGQGDRFGWRLAVLAGRDVQFGLVRMASAFADGRELDLHAFRDEAEARSWLAGSATDESPS